MTSPKPDLRKFHHFFAFGFGAGLAPRAPGTVGTLAAIPVYALLIQLPFWAYCGVTAIFFVVGISWCGKTAEDLGVHDHSGIVWDEVVGFLLTMMWLPPTLVSVVVGFVLFRLFDIVKPPPIHWADARIGGGFGIMLDDALAALYAGIGGYFLLQFFAG